MWGETKLSDVLTSDDVEPAPPPTDSELARISMLAQRQREEEEEVIRCTAQLQEAQRRLRRTSDVDLPEAMRAVGVGSFTLTSGEPVKLITQYDGKKITDPEALDWIEEHGGASLIKTEVFVSMDRGQVEAARELVEVLRRHPLANQFKELRLETYVHNATAGAFARELAEGGTILPDILGVNHRTYAQVGERRPKSVDLRGLSRR